MEEVPLSDWSKGIRTERQGYRTKFWHKYSGLYSIQIKIIFMPLCSTFFIWILQYVLQTKKMWRGLDYLKDWLDSDTYMSTQSYSVMSLNSDFISSQIQNIWRFQENQHFADFLLYQWRCVDAWVWLMLWLSRLWMHLRWSRALAVRQKHRTVEKFIFIAFLSKKRFSQHTGLT